MNEPQSGTITFGLRAHRAGHGAKARARLATGGSPVDPSSYEASDAEFGRSRPSREQPAGRKKHDFTLLYILGCERGPAAYVGGFGGARRS